MAVEGLVAGEVGRQVPVLPTVVAAEGDLLPAGECAGDANGDGHRLAAAAGEAGLARPGVELAEQIGQPHLRRGVQRTHAAGVDGVLDGAVHVVVGVAQDAGADAHRGHVHEPPPVQVPDVAALALAVIGRPLVRQEHLRPLAEKLRPAGDPLLGVKVELRARILCLRVHSSVLITHYSRKDAEKSTDSLSPISPRRGFRALTNAFIPSGRLSRRRPSGSDTKTGHTC